MNKQALYFLCLTGVDDVEKKGRHTETHTAEAINTDIVVTSSTRTMRPGCGGKECRPSRPGGPESAEGSHISNGPIAAAGLVRHSDAMRYGPRRVTV